MGGDSDTTFCIGTMRWMALVIGLAGLFLTAGCSCLSQPHPEPDETESKAAAKTPSMSVQAPPSGEFGRSPESEESRIAAKPSAPQEGWPTSLLKTTQDISETEPEPAAVAPQVEAKAATDTSPEQLGAKEEQQVEGQPEAPFEKQADKPVEKQVEKQTEMPTTPPLDLDLLEQRLRETRAIGVFTKLALKNQVDDLLDKFQAYYQGHSGNTLDQLRQPYEMLMMKVLALLQDSDPPLARDILDSREAIWEVLSDPEKFASY